MKLLRLRSKKFWISILVLLIAIVFALAYCSRVHTDNASIVKDFDTFIRLLEKSHPDPYTNYGGKTYFHLAAEKTRQSLIQDTVTSLNEFANRINEFLAPLQDGHTKVYLEDDSIAKSRAAITFEVINDGIIVKRIERQYENLIGSRLLAIENTPIKEVYHRLAKYWPAENEIGQMILINEFGTTADHLSKVLPNMSNKSVNYQLLTPDGKQVNLNLPFMSDDSQREKSLTSKQCSDLFPSHNLSYDYVDQEKKTMYLRLTQISARDCIDTMKDMGMDYSRVVESFYKDLGKEMPSDLEQAVAQMPSLSEVFEQMLLSMKQNSSVNLIIDLRGNGGGFTPIATPTLYQMWGDEYIKKAANNFGTKSYTLCSRLYTDKYTPFPIPLWVINLLEGTDYKYGDYIQQDAIEITEITDSVRDIILARGISCIAEHLNTMHGKPIYTPEHVYVLTDPYTFSAAFHYAFYLWKMGATVVGVPCAQAPNTYMELTPFGLPRTKLQGSISNTLQMFLPKDDPRAKVFYPDLMPTYEDYKRYHFDDNAIPLYLMDMIKKN